MLLPFFIKTNDYQEKVSQKLLCIQMCLGIEEKDYSQDYLFVQIIWKIYNSVTYTQTHFHILMFIL